VIIDGLQSKPELNGTYGTMQSFDDGTGRWNVQLEDSGSVLALKPANLTSFSQKKSFRTPRQPKAQAGIKEEVEKGKEKQNRKQNQKQQPQQEEAVLKPGAKVIIDGLKSKPELNGSEATAVSFDADTGRWNVKTGSGSVLALKAANLSPCRRKKSTAVKHSL
jgi:hypothetical protein